MAWSRPGSSIVLAIGSLATTTTRTSGGGGAAAGGADFEQAARNRAAPTRRARPDLIIEGGYSARCRGATGVRGEGAGHLLLRVALRIVGKYSVPRVSVGSRLAEPSALGVSAPSSRTEDLARMRRIERMLDPLETLLSLNKPPILD